ncbi:hypothetical protein [Lactococcus lactis]|uniref:hypothetical protein n=1 Tax=Lactococcus lactis TaxID=1358 RepID=UPI002072E0CB|nr:hypothetical protein [Lactococcus lactis]
MSYEKQTWNQYDELKTEEENIKNGAVVTDNRMNHMETGIGDNDNNLASHLADKNNPHKVTAAQVGLGNVQNFGLATEDEAKQGISNAKYMTPSLTQAVLSANINSIAYANSADGMDGFTTVYPNLNLLSNSLFKNPLKLTVDSNSALYGLQSNVVGSEYVPSTSNPDLTISSLYVAGLKLPIGVYTSSITIANNSETVATVQFILMGGTADTGINPAVNGVDIPWEAAYSNPRVTINIPPKSNKRYTLTFTAKSTNNTNGGSVPQFLIFRETTAIPVTRYSKPKLEPGSIATPWMPSATEVTTADYPKYVGFSNTVKTNKSASDYTWFPVKDSELTNKVEAHINNKANPHAVTASQVGAYTKSESDSKLTDLSNKAILNKGNIASGTDLNSVTGTGFYRIGGLLGGTDVLNVPSELSGLNFYAFLKVTGELQELTVYSPKQDTTWTYSRSISGTTPTWSSWSKAVMADESGKVILKDFEVTTISETVNIGNGLLLNFQRKGEFVLVRFSGSLTAINSGTYFSTAVPDQWRPDGIKELIGHFASGALAFHVDLETDGRVKWWGASGATGAPRGTAMYFLK